MSLIPQQLQRIKDTVDRCITYTPDIVVYDVIEKWVCLYDQIKANPKVKLRGDCEDFALTYAKFCEHDLSIDPSKIRMVFCLIKNAGYHMVCMVDADDTTYVLCCNQHEPRIWTDLEDPREAVGEYVFLKSMRLSEPNVWREVPVTPPQASV